MSTTLPGTGAPSRRFLTFRLETELFGIDILQVQEIKGYTAVTPIPNAPAFVRGVMNLRGNIIPVLDLRLRFGMPPAEPGRFTVVIVVTLASRTLGLIVDSVSDVADIEPAAVRPTAELGLSLGSHFVHAVATQGDRLVVLLEMERLLEETRDSSEGAGAEERAHSQAIER